MPYHLSPVSKSHKERSAPHSASPAPTVLRHSYDHLNIWQREWLLLTDSCTLAVGPARVLCMCHKFIILDFRQQYHIGSYQHHKHKCVMLQAMEITDAERLEKLALPTIPPHICSKLESHGDAQLILNPLRAQKQYVGMSPQGQPVLVQPHPALLSSTSPNVAPVSSSVPPTPSLTLVSPTSPALPPSLPPAPSPPISWNGSLGQQVHDRLLRTGPRVYRGSIPQRAHACDGYTGTTATRSGTPVAYAGERRIFPESYERSGAQAADFMSTKPR